MRTRIDTQKFLILALCFILFCTLATLTCRTRYPEYVSYPEVSKLYLCRFKILSIEDPTLLKVPLRKIRDIGSFSFLDGLELASGFAQGNLPFSFTLNIAVRNPNDGGFGVNRVDAALTRFDWTLFYQNKEMAKGNIPNTFEIPGNGLQIIIPLQVRFNLIEFLKGQTYENMINLALTLGGLKGSTESLVLEGSPNLETEHGSMQYPEKIFIVDFEFRAS
jgi:hypothetical protein